MFCKHNWSKVSEITLPSAWEQIAEASKGFKIESVHSWYFRKAHTVLLVCTNCGRTKEVRTVNP